MEQAINKSNLQAIQVFSPHTVSQNLTFNDTPTAAIEIPKTCKCIRTIFDSDCYVKFGDENIVANTTNSMLLKSGIIEPIGVPEYASHVSFVSINTNTVNGNLTLGAYKE